MKQKERTKRDEEKAKASGLKKIHPLVPVRDIKSVLEHCAKLREKHKRELGL